MKDTGTERVASLWDTLPCESQRLDLYSRGCDTDHTSIRRRQAEGSGRRTLMCLLRRLL